MTPPADRPAPQAWNPRYVAYALAHGETPDGMTARDETRYPGGCMAGYIAWITAQWSGFRRAHPDRCALGTPRATLHAAFDAWLFDALPAEAPVLSAQVPATAGLPLFDEVAHAA